MSMGNIFKSFIRRHGGKLCALALVIATVASEGCRHVWYQPQEPEGLEEFAARRKNN